MNIHDEYGDIVGTTPDPDHPFDPSPSTPSGAQRQCVRCGLAEAVHGLPDAQAAQDIALRLAGHELQRELRRSLITVTSALYDPRAKALTALEFVGACPVWDRASARWLLRDCGISELRRIRDLTPTQAGLIASRVGRKDAA